MIRTWSFVLALALLFAPLAALVAQEVQKQPLPDTPLAVTAQRAFKKFKPYRPIVITHFGDGSNRLVVAEQTGKIYVLKPGEDVESPALLINLESKIEYKDKENEEGLLGLAFHPKFKENGAFFVYYTAKYTGRPGAKRESVVSRFRLSQEDSAQGDPASEVELLRIPQPFWNHNGGTLCFGPDGMLYIGLGDGGAANDPQGNGQKMDTLLGKILRIDVDQATSDKPYGIPADNPFVKTAGARPEIYALGVRNIWRMSFDRATGAFWVADVGQNLWEEINIVKKGDNLGWNIRESRHGFNPPNAGPRPELLEPIWEYHHDIGKSITGGHVYRGKQVPALVGKYLYADYVTGKIWALEYDAQAGQVKANYILQCVDQNPPIMTFGEGEDGEVYCASTFGFIYTFTGTNR